MRGALPSYAAGLLLATGLLLICSSLGSSVSSMGTEGKDAYSILGVSREEATDKTIKAAYRKMALKYHPDKNKGDPEAAKIFTKVAEAYEQLKDAASRRSYDANLRSGGPASRASAFGFRDAEAMFNEDFGESLWRGWQPGMRVEGELYRGGRRKKMVIYPDGTVEEEESGEVGGMHGASTVRKTTRSGPGGSYTSMHVELNGGHLLGELLSALLPAWAKILVAPLAFVVGWLPCILFARCMWGCCGCLWGSGGRDKRHPE